MQAIVRLQLQTLKAEFPSYEFMQSMQVLRLERSSMPTAASVAKLSESVHMRRLAANCNVKLDDLKAEFMDHFLMAMRELRRDPSLDNFGAWRTALSRTRAAGRHPQTTLIQVLMRFGACIGCTTPGAEQPAENASTTSQ